MSIQTEIYKYFTLRKITRPQILTVLFKGYANHGGEAGDGKPPSARESIAANEECRVGEKRTPFPQALPKLVNPHFPHPSQMPMYQAHKRPAPFPNEPIQPTAKHFPKTITEARGEPWTRQYPR